MRRSRGVSAFIDQMMIRLADPAQLTELVAPAADTARQQIKTLLSQAYEFPSSVVHDVTAVTVVSSQSQRPIFPPRRLAGVWSQTSPAYIRTDVSYEGTDGFEPRWIDVMAELSVTVVLEIDPGEVESISLGDLGTFTTLDEFRSKFRFFDLTSFMSRHQLTTVDELKRAFQFLRGEIHLKPQPNFDPQAPENQRRLALSVAVLLRDAIDLVAGLRDARLAVEAGQRALAYRTQLDEAEATVPFAPMLVFPEADVAATGFTIPQLQDFVAAQQAVALFVTP
jgi:hypothetical protein